MKIYESKYNAYKYSQELRMYDTITQNMVVSYVSPEFIIDLEAVHGINYEKFFKAQASIAGGERTNSVLELKFFVTKFVNDIGAIVFRFETTVEDVDFDSHLTDTPNRAISV